VPVGPQLNPVLIAYSQVRRKAPRPARNESAFFATRSGTALARGAAERIFRRLCEHGGIRRIDGGRFQPRIHDIRHYAEFRIMPSSEEVFPAIPCISYI